MRLLLDTHAWLWWDGAPRRLSDEARSAIADRQNEVFLSAASSWEIAIKAAMGKLTLVGPVEEYVPARMSAQGISPLAVEHAHALRVASLPRHHADPFDRLLVVQAQLEGLTIVTVDHQLALYEVDLLWAGPGPPRRRGPRSRRR